MYSLLNQALVGAESEMGSGKTWAPPASNTQAAVHDWWSKYFLPYTGFTIIKECTYVNYTNCWAANSTYLNNQLIGGQGGIYQILKNGMIFNYSSTFNNGASEAFIFVDINGVKKPNKMGKDIFVMVLNYPKGKMRFYGAGLIINRAGVLDSNDNVADCNKLTMGFICGALIQHDGWKISKDYPW